MNDARLTRLVLAGFCVLLFFVGLSNVGLTGADEPRYAQIAREMLARHDWVTPVLNGRPWLEKPVLYYWEAMLSYGLFGVSDWAARVPAAVDATLLVLAAYFFARRFWPGIELTAALITASCALVVGFGHAASTDMPLAATFAIAMLFWMAWHAPPHRAKDGRGGDPAAEPPRPWPLVGFYLFLGLGTLAKGPVAPFLAGLIIVVFALLRRKARIIRETLWLPGILLFLGVALPWYVLVQLRTGNFFQFFILEHNLGRFTTPVFHHPQPFWYFLWILPLAILPWTVLSITGFVQAIRGARGPRSKSADLDLLLALWGALPVIFFSFSASKLPGYVLPVTPAFALLAASYLHRKFEAGERLHPALVLGHALAAGAMLTVVLLAPYLALRHAPPRQALMVAIGTGIVALVLIALVVSAAGLRTLRFITLAPVLVGLAFILRPAAPMLDATFSARPVARELASLQPEPAPVAVFNAIRETEYGLNFYRNQPILRYERGDVPAGAHLLAARAVSAKDIAARVGGRQFVLLGRFPRQGLDFYWVSAR